MSRSSHQTSLTSAVVETGQVIDVDVETYTISVVTQFTQKPLTGIAFATPYQHFANGEGIYFMPEVGSLVWLCWPSDGSRPFVMGWSPAREASGSLRSKKMALNPGDIYLGTRDENFIILRRGGIVQIGGGPICQRMFLPVNNAIKDFCENYGLHALGGDLEWTIDRPQSTTDGKRPALLTLKAREFANDEEPVAVLKIGSHSTNSKNILSLDIRESGSKGAASKITLQFRKDGTAKFKFESDVDWSVTESLKVRAEKTMTLSAGQDMNIDGATVGIEAKKGAATVKGATTIDLMAGTSVNVSPQLAVGGAGGKAMLLADSGWLAWIATHLHSGVQPGSGVTGPPNTYSGTGHISKKSTSS